MANTLTVFANGPFELAADTITLGGEAVEAPAYLCRCGASKTPPFCDGSHKDAGFSDEAIFESNDAVRPCDGAVALTAFPDGPVAFKGALEITGADGSKVRLEKGFLCRCGASKTKPFCDGAHKDINFKAP